MKKPSNIELWLYDVNVGGLIVESRMTGCDASETFWKLIPTDAFGNTKGCDPARKFPDHAVKGLVDLNPDHCSVLRLRYDVVKRVREWKAFAEKEARDLAEYNRLKRKFKG